MRMLSDAELDRLDAFLLGLDEDSVTLSGFDGLCAAVVICPDPVPPSVWLPAVWGEDGPTFANASEAQAILDLVMARFNQVSWELDRVGRYGPLLDRDTDEAWLWEGWAEGFARAFAATTPSTWSVFETADDINIRASMGLLVRLAQAAVTGERIEGPLDSELRGRADLLIAQCLETLAAARRAADAIPVRRTVAKIGRNDPCPCGSGRKYKVCCLQ